MKHLQSDLFFSYVLQSSYQTTEIIYQVPKSRGKYMFLLTLRALKSHFTVSSSIYAYHLYCQQGHAQDAKATNH